jgi:integrase
VRSALSGRPVSRSPRSPVILGFSRARWVTGSPPTAPNARRRRAFNGDAAELTRLRAENVSGELAAYEGLQHRGGLVFPSASGTPLRNRNRRRDVFDSAVEALGLNITPHNLRDTAASLAIQAGASVVAVARLLGHESPATTLNHYAGLFPTDLDDIASRLDAAARLTIARQRESSDAKLSPTKHRPDEAETVRLSQS